jgi:peptide/nickel transport system substrate-binding protein
MNKQRLFLLLSIAAVMLLIAACGGAAQPETITVVETVVVEKEVQVEVPKEVIKEVEVVKEVEVEKEVEKLVTARGTGGAVNLLYWQAVSIVNPYLSSGTKDFHAGSVVLEPLAEYDEASNIVPALAAEVPTLDNGGVAEDLTSITWKLKEGVLWSDGTPFTAEDVAFTWEYCVNPESGCSSAASFEGVENVEAVDDLTVKITYDAPRPYPYVAFVGQLTPVIQKAQFQDCVGAAAQGCSEQNSFPIGTGPFKVKEFKANDVVTFEVNENCRDPNKPFFSEVVMKGGGDAASAARAALETGEVDYAWNLQVEPQILNAMAAAGKGKLVTAFSGNVERILINFTNPSPDLGDKRSEWTPEDPNPHPFLTDPVVRQAMSMAIDRNVISTQLYGAAGKPTCNILSGPPQVVSAANDACLTQDIAGANAMLDEAGIVDSDGDGVREKDGVPLVVLYATSTNPVRQKTQALVKQWWSEIGIETELRDIDAAVYFGGDVSSPDTLGKFYFDVQMFTNGPDSTDPQNYLSNWICEKSDGTYNIPNAGNQDLGNATERWCGEEFDAAFQELTETADPEQRVELAKQLNDLLAQNYVNLPLVFRGSVSAHANSLLGVRMNGWDSELWNIEDWSRSGQ